MLDSRMGLVGGFGFAYHRKALFTFKHVTQAVPHHRMIVHQKHTMKNIGRTSRITGRRVQTRDFTGHITTWAPRWSSNAAPLASIALREYACTRLGGPLELHVTPHVEGAADRIVVAAVVT